MVQLVDLPTFGSFYGSMLANRPYIDCLGTYDDEMIDSPDEMMRS